MGTEGVLGGAQRHQGLGGPLPWKRGCKAAALGLWVDRWRDQAAGGNWLNGHPMQLHRMPWTEGTEHPDTLDGGH